MLEISLIALILLQFADAISTFYAMAKPESYEKNPLMARLMIAIGRVPALLIKLVIGAGAVAAIWKTGIAAHPYPMLSMGIIWMMIVVYAYVINGNYKIAKGR